jgi:hypothetical protein
LRPLVDRVSGPHHARSGALIRDVDERAGLRVRDKSTIDFHREAPLSGRTHMAWTGVGDVIDVHQVNGGDVEVSRARVIG